MRAYSNDDGVLPVMTTSLSRSFPLGGVSDGKPEVVEEAPPPNVPEGPAQMSRSMSYFDVRPSLHSRWMNQDGDRPRLDSIIGEGETPKSKMVTVEVRTFPLFPS